MTTNTVMTRFTIRVLSEGLGARDGTRDGDVPLIGLGRVDGPGPARRAPAGQRYHPAGRMSLPLSVLDLSPVPSGPTAAEALRNTIDLARSAEGWGYRRHWLAEHHNMPGARQLRDRR